MQIIITRCFDTFIHFCELTTMVIPIFCGASDRYKYKNYSNLYNGINMEKSIAVDGRIDTSRLSMPQEIMPAILSQFDVKTLIEKKCV